MNFGLLKRNHKQKERVQNLYHLFSYLSLKRFEVSHQILGLTGFKCKTILSHLTYKLYNNYIKGIRKQPIFTALVEQLTLAYEQLGQLLKFENLAHNLAMLVIVAFQNNYMIEVKTLFK